MAPLQRRDVRAAGAPESSTLGAAGARPSAAIRCRVASGDQRGYEVRVVAAAAYTRVSSRQQDLRLQRREIERAAASRGDQIPKRLWFEDKASGRSIDRPALKKLQAAVRAGKVRRLYVWRVDRLTRSGIRDTFHLVEEFRHHGAELVTVADGFTLSGPAADVVLAVMAWAAQMERNAIGERIRAARARIEAEGGRWGRPRNGELDPKTLRRARELRDTHSLRELAALLKVPRSTLADALGGKGHYARPAAAPARKTRS